MLGIVCITSYKENNMTRTSTQDLQEEFLTSLRKSQKTIIGALRIWVDTVTTVTPRLSPLTDKLPKLPSVTVPFAGKLPTPEEAVDSAYGLAEQLLANQRKFADDMLALTIPLMSGRRANVTTKTAPRPELKVVQVASKPEPKFLQVASKPAVVVPEPKAAAPKPAEPKAAVVVPEFKPAVVAPEPKPAVVKTEPSVVASAPKPAPAKSPAPKAAAPKAAAPKRTPRPAAKPTPKAAG
jgi:hypothetical protein